MRLPTLRNVLSVLLVPLVMTLCAWPARANENDACQLIARDVDVIKYMTQTVSCTAKVILTKCEGTCESSVTPSVLHYSGFKRDCRCCKEGEVTTHTVTLPACTDNGVPIDLSGTTIVTNITSCICDTCTN